jgi:hypothetical protein
MHKYTQLKKDELARKIRDAREKEWDEAASLAARTGFPLLGGAFISKVVDIGFKFLEEFIDGLFEAEKAAISKNTVKQDEKYFHNLGQEFRVISEQETNVIRSRVLPYLQGVGKLPSAGILEYIGHKGADLRESINRRVLMMEQELELGISNSSIHQNIQVTGDGAVINTGQVFGSINSTVQRVSETGATELANAFLRIAQGIKDSNIDEAQKLEHLQKVEYLAAQCEIPEGQRKKGVIKSVIQGLERSLPTIANLATIWAQVAPIIMKAFDK